MPSRSPSRGRTRTRSPYSDVSNPRAVSRSPSRPRRTISPRSPSRSPRRNGRYRSESRSRSASHGRSPSPIRSTKVVVEKLTKNVNEDHLREIFSIYGQIRDLDMPMNRAFNTNRGTAYILYTSESDAEAAIAHMHESQIDGAVINVSIVLPRRKFSPSPPVARRGANIDPPTLDPREILIHIAQDHYLDLDLLGVIELDLDRFLLALVPVLDPHLEDEEGEETALAVTVAGVGEARAIAAIAVMTIGIGVEAEVEVVREVVAADVRQWRRRSDLQRWSLGQGKRKIVFHSRYQWIV
ncbi:hypothetical protein EG329_002277 [Mollisiaceae sp. DMI_Dod_QoI]|nr:hypothetical protein EG329_002277 [Helotiales sp. DMI_Dod_QoI]